MKLFEIEINHHHNKLPEMRIMAAIRQLKEIIMGTQADFDQKVAVINAKLDGLTSGLSTVEEAVHLEAEQVRQFIADHPDLDTSALDGVAERLDSAGLGVSAVAGSIGNILADPPPAEEPPAEEPDNPETPVG